MDFSDLKWLSIGCVFTGTKGQKEMWESGWGQGSAFNLAGQNFQILATVLPSKDRYDWELGF